MLQRVLGLFSFSLIPLLAQVSFDPSAILQNGLAQKAPAVNPNAKRYPVTGTVVNALTGAPIPRAQVMLQSAEPARAFTGDDGHFELKDVLEGAASISARRPGFHDKGFRSITVSATTSSIELKLTPGGTLSGHIINSDGEPVEGVQLELFFRSVTNGHRNWTMRGGTNTDEAGNYVFEQLTPGSYLVRTQPHQVFPYASSVVVDGRHFPELYPPQYFPNAPDRSSAQPLQLLAGAEAQADFTLTAVPSYTASGTLAGQARGFSGQCVDTDGDLVSSFYRADPQSGHFSISRLPVGACTLVIHTGFAGETDDSHVQLFGELPLLIKSNDIDGLQLNLQPLADIPVSISGGDASLENGGLNLTLIEKDRSTGRIHQAMRKNDALVIPAVQPGAYTVVANAFGKFCIGAVNSGGVDLLHSDLNVPSGGSAPPITITMRSDCATLSAKITDPNAPATVPVFIVPDSSPGQSKVSFANNGALQMNGLTPGDYTVYAADDMSNVAYADADAMKGLSGQRVTLQASGQGSVEIPKVNITAAEAR